MQWVINCFSLNLSTHHLYAWENSNLGFLWKLQMLNHALTTKDLILPQQHSRSKHALCKWQQYRDAISYIKYSGHHVEYIIICDIPGRQISAQYAGWTDVFRFEHIVIVKRTTPPFFFNIPVINYSPPAPSTLLLIEDYHQVNEMQNTLLFTNQMPY